MKELAQSSRALAERVKSGHQSKAVQTWLAFGLLSALQAGGELSEETGPTVADTALVLLFAFTVGVLLQWLVFAGLQLHLGAKLMGGVGTFKDTVSATATAAIVPAAVGFLPATIYPYLLASDNTLWAIAGLGLMVLYVILNFWAWIRCVNAARLVHELSGWRAILLAIWLPLLMMVLLIVVIVAFPNLFAEV